MSYWWQNFELRVERELKQRPGSQKLLLVVFGAFLFFLLAFATQTLISQEIESSRRAIDAQLDEVLSEVQVSPALMDEIISELLSEPELDLKNRLLLERLKSFRVRDLPESSSL